jgi:circadian clock protein KaiB
MTDESSERPEAFDGRTVAHYVLKLYVTGQTPRSTRAIENMRRICETHLKGRYDLEVIDIYERPEAVREQQIIAAPTLVRLLPEPLRRVIGDLSDRERVLAGLDLAALPNEGGANP